MQNEDRGTEVAVPHLAESLVSATIGKWLKQPGDYIQEFDILCELLTDKVNVEMPSPIEGTLIRILVTEGETAGVGEPICIIRKPEEPEQEAPVKADAKSTAKISVPAGDKEIASSPRYSPAVLHLAKVHRIDLHQIKGTGLGGRITRKDVLAYVNSGADAAPSIPAASPAPVKPEAASHARAAAVAVAKVEATAEAEVVSVAKSTEDEHISVTPLRSMIATRMKQSVAEIPHAWMMTEADVSGLVALRQRLKDRFAAKEGVQLTYAPFVIKAIVNAIKDYPMLNSTWASDRIIVKKEIHLSVAVGSETSVVTPVLRNADRKTIAGLAIELGELVKRARAGKLTLSDVQGGTFTFNNTGSFGSVLSQPIINYPQAAILTFESIIRKPVALQGDAIAIRSMVNLCLSLDHRILDGMICGRFLQRVKQFLEQYDPDTVIY